MERLTQPLPVVNPDQVGPLMPIFADIPADPIAQAVAFTNAARKEHPDNDDNAVAAIMLRLARRLARRPDPYLGGIYAAIARDRAVGHALIAWARLSPVERARLRKRAHSTTRRYRTDDRPPTDRQLAYLRDLGFPGHVKTRREAFDLIAEYRRELRGGRR